MNWKFWEFITGAWVDRLETKVAKEEYAKQLASIGTQLYFTALGVAVGLLTQDLSKIRTPALVAILLIAGAIALVSFFIRATAMKRLDQANGASTSKSKKKK